MLLLDKLCIVHLWHWSVSNAYYTLFYFTYEMNLILINLFVCMLFSVVSSHIFLSVHLLYASRQSASFGNNFKVLLT